MLKPNVGRALSAAGAILLLISLVLVWYHVERPTGIESSTGWDAFPRLRWIVAGGAVLTLATALVRQVRWVLVARTVLGVVLAVLILRRIVDPPEISSPVVTQFGVYAGLLGALAVAFGGLVDTGRELVVPVMGLGGAPRGELPSGSARPVGGRDHSRNASPGGATVHAPNPAQQRRT
jgi:hypothetical protein